MTSPTSNPPPGATMPEELLPPLNRALLRLRAAAATLGDDSIETAFVNVLRQTETQEYLISRLLVAVAGAQGAGKTTLVRELYDLDDTWLGATAGRGERVPVLVVEDDDATAASGWVLTLGNPAPDEDSDEGSDDLPARQAEAVVESPDTATVAIGPEEFARCLEGLDEHRLLLGLTVPPGVFGRTGRGFLLLPGYEELDRSNEDWQNLMRQALVAAPAALVVVDRALLASDEQDPILEDLRDNQLGEAQPLVVISKTERSDDGERAALRKRAAVVFPGSDNRIVTTGSGDPAYREAWFAELRDVLDRGLPRTDQMRQRQLEHLQSIARREVTSLIRHVRDAAYAAPGGEEARSYRKALQTFDTAAAEVLTEYMRCVREELDHHRRLAYRRVGDVVEGNTETGRRLRQLGLAASGRSFVYRRELENEFQRCWWRATEDGRGFAGGHLRATARAVLGLGPLLIENEGGWLSSDVLSDLRALGPAKAEPDNQHQFGEALNRAVTLIPLMALEALRTAMTEPALVGLNAETLTGTEQPMSEPDVQRVLLELGQERLALLSGFGALLGIDAVSKGEVHEPSKLAEGLQRHLFGGAQLARAGQLAVGSLVSVVSVAAMAGAVIVYINRLVIRQDTMGREIIDNLHEAHLTTIGREFQRLIRLLRQQVDFALRRYFRVDPHEARAVEIDRALAECELANDRLLAALGRPPRSRKRRGPGR